MKTAKQENAPTRPNELLGPEMSPELLNQRVGDEARVRARAWWWWLALFATAGGVFMMFTAITWVLAKGVGIWGLQIPVAWGFAIINFVWWIGIGHAGTFISAILLLLQQDWRNSINRFTEAMTLFAVACAGLFPLLHLGRPQYFYYLIPYPNEMGLWPQFRSPLVWDFFAVSTYGTVSLIFWYLGLVPDLATMRDRTKPGLRKKIYAFFSLGWLGRDQQWKDYRALYFMLAGLATPLVISVHSIVGLDFAVSIVPGWHSTVFPPYFVAGAIFSGFAMVATLVIPIRKLFKLEGMITTRHLDNIGKVMLATGMMVGFGYVSEVFFEWYSGDAFEMQTLMDRLTGYYAPVFWTVIFCNVISIQALWWRGIRTNPWLLWILAGVANIGMWMERYLIVVTSLGHDYLTSSWQDFNATGWDWALYLGTLCFFFFLVVLFVRLIPMVSMHEIREILHERAERGKEAS
ncbi:MAG: polysulfide reductase [Puniceicoccaceae bacterium 5H]|nr:MAG: polysulfide reductase [Puniceicoccaceae bacterium 5H]